jgi:MFS family permease
LGCLVVMTIGMLAAMQASSIVELSIWRIITGLGIGGMLAAINALAAEFANTRRRTLCLAIMVIGYPIGGVLGGMVAAKLLAQFDWRAVFGFGAAATLVFIPLVLAFVPETPAFLVERRPANALARLNAVLVRIGAAAVSALPDVPAHQPKRSVTDIFAPAHRLSTLVVTLAYFAHVISFYFILKWVPKIVVDMGFAQAQAAGVLVWANVGAVIGGALFGLLALRFGLKPLTIGALLLSSLMIVYFGRTAPVLDALALHAAGAQFFVEAGIVGLYSIFAQAFPTHIRATATGFAIGIGRGGAALAPVLAGGLFQSGMALPQVATIMAGGSLVAGLVLMLLRVRVGHRVVV